MTERPDTPVPYATRDPGDGRCRDTQDAERQGAVEARNRRLAHAVVAGAEDVLLSRYRLESRQEAFELLRSASQRHNTKLHTLADATLRSPAPDPAGRRWFSRPHRPGPPPLPGLPLNDGASTTSDSAVLKAAMRRVLHINDTTMGNVQLVESGMLRMEKHTGLNRRFTDFFAFIESTTTSCAQAAEQNRQVTVKDVAASDTFDEASREAILQSGSRACHSVPLTTPRGTVLGMISSHHEQTLNELTGAQLTALRHLGSQVGRWLVWHRNTVVLDALEDLHATARR
ncbi:ANTAR domain-containing protein [Streptomyces sp. NPDC047706]|uniref:ANTAR domain-containing protein n=1 Tax=Streptomyces sp. NPDC047706 TaxID=3365486 RepID=UPI00370FA19E